LCFTDRSTQSFSPDDRWVVYNSGDGTPAVAVKSDGNVKPRASDGYAETIHRYAMPGHYLVRVERVGHTGAKAIAHLHERVGREP
jgi:hypothetical protein